MGEIFFRVRTPEVTFEDFQSEVLIIDLKTGHYHSLRGSAASIWRLLDSGHSLEACVSHLGRWYQADASTLESDTRAFLQQLELAGLVAVAPPPESSTDVAMEDPPETYLKPVIDSYGDLQDLLLLDPIHEIAPEAGWPQRREEA